MAVESDRDPVIIECVVPFGNECLAMPGQGAKNRIVQPGHPYSAELHDLGSHEYLASSGMLVA